MSGPAETNLTPITDRSDLLAWFSRGGRPKAQWAIGAEHEKFLLDKETSQPLPYFGKPGIGEMLATIASSDSAGCSPIQWTKVLEGEHLIALKGSDGSSLTLEPGGQFELSGAILPDLHKICQETSCHLKDVKVACEKIGAKVLSMGFFPKGGREQFSWMPKGRYQIMRDYMPTRGSLGVDMMQRTCTVQVNLDFADEADMIRKMRVSSALQPLATALFANSPFVGGKPSGYKSWRGHIWTDTDNDRCGIPPLVFADNFGFDTWLDYILDVPMYFVRRDNRYINLAGKSFRDFMAGRFAPSLQEEVGQATIGDFADHVTTAFPEVRLKSYIEMRGADAGPWGHLCALPALWVGLLYDSQSLSAAEDLVKHWRYDELLSLREHATRHALEGEVTLGGVKRQLQPIAKEVVSIALSGLKARAIKDNLGRDESRFVEPLLEIASTGKTLADRMLADYHGAWQGDISPLFTGNDYLGGCQQCL